MPMSIVIVDQENGDERTVDVVNQVLGGTPGRPEMHFLGADGGVYVRTTPRDNYYSSHLHNPVDATPEMPQEPEQVSHEPQAVTVNDDAGAHNAQHGEVVVDLNGNIIGWEATEPQPQTLDAGHARSENTVGGSEPQLEPAGDVTEEPVGEAASVDEDTSLD